jgi:hypothetical protein
VNPSQTFATGQWNGTGRNRADIIPSLRVDFTEAASLAAVEAGGGNLYWRDIPNNILWIKFLGNVPSNWDDWLAADQNRTAFYRERRVVIRS